MVTLAVPDRPRAIRSDSIRGDGCALATVSLGPRFLGTTGPGTRGKLPHARPPCAVDPQAGRCHMRLSRFWPHRVGT